MRLGNRLADLSADIVKLCYDNGVIGVEENPLSSFLWLHDSRVQQLGRPNVLKIVD